MAVGTAITISWSNGTSGCSTLGAVKIPTGSAAASTTMAPARMTAQLVQSDADPAPPVAPSDGDRCWPHDHAENEEQPYPFGQAVAEPGRDRGGDAAHSSASAAASDVR